MSIAENAQKNDEQRKAMASTVAAGMLGGLPTRVQDLLMPETVERLLQAHEGFDVSAAQNHLDERIREFSELNGLEFLKGWSAAAAAA